MDDFDIVKPHINLLSDGSTAHKNALLADPIEAISVGGKLLEGWTTPPFPSVFSWAANAVTAPSKQAAATGKQQTPPPKKDGEGDGQPDQPAGTATADPAAPLTEKEIKMVWRKWEARVADKLKKIDRIPTGQPSKMQYDEIGSVLESVREVLDAIESEGYSKYLLREFVRTGPF